MLHVGQSYLLLIIMTIIFIIILQIRTSVQKHQKCATYHAEQIKEAKLQFFINISHEIRTPVSNHQSSTETD
jgi:signal transduction histidine kinase